MKSIFPISKEYGDLKKEAQAAAPVQPQQQSGGFELDSSFTKEDVEALRQAHELVLRVTARLGSAGGIRGGRPLNPSPEDQQAAALVNKAASALETILTLIK